MLKDIKAEQLERFNLSDEYVALILQSEVLAIEILPYLPISIQYYTDHGVRHSERIIDLFEDFLDNFGDVLTSEEKLLILISCWLHDIGCILGRDKHSKSSIKILNDMDFFKILIQKLGSDLYECLKFIIVAHSSWYDLSDLPKSILHTKINILKTALIFRFLDECDLTAKRIGLVYDIVKKYKILNKDAEKYWDAHKYVISVVFKNNIINISCDDKKHIKILLNHFRKELRVMNNFFPQVDLPTMNIKINEMKNLRF